jgi:putative DNA primase/helicase
VSDYPVGKIVEYRDAGKNSFNELLSVRALERVLTMRAKEDEWYVWEGKAWMKRSKSMYLPTALEVLPQSVRCVRHAKTLIEHMEAKHQIAPDEKLAGAIMFDPASTEAERIVLINLENGTLRVTAETVELLKHDKTRLFTGYLPTPWIQGASRENFMRVLREALPVDASGVAEGVSLMQWWGGYLLLPNCEKELFLICYGPSGTGKSTIAETMCRVLGEDPMVASLTLSQLCAGEKAYSLPKLQYAIVNMGTELDTVDVEDASALKRLVSGEAVEARNIFGRPFTMRTSAKLWFNANDLPRFKHGTDAELRRVRFLHFDQFPKCPECEGKGFIEDFTSEKPPKCEKCRGTKIFRDARLKGSQGLLAQESSGVLGWMVQGLQDYLGGIECPEGGVRSKQVKAQFAVSNDPVKAFFDSDLIAAPDGRELKSEVAERFKSFMDHRGFPGKSIEALFRALYQRFPFIKPVRIKEGSESKHYLAGVSLREL